MNLVESVILLKKAVALLLISLLCFSCASCMTAYSEQLNIGLPSAPTTVDPQLAQTKSELLAARNIFEGLIRLDNSENVNNGIAESYEINDLIYTFHLRKDAVWSDGVKITANDFVFAFQRAVDPTTEAPYYELMSSIVGYDNIRNGKTKPATLGVTATDDHTLIIKLKHKDNKFLQKLASPVFMPCRADFFYKCAGRYGRDTDNIITNGPYRVRSWSDSTIKLVRFEDYAGENRANARYAILKYVAHDERIKQFTNEGYDIIFTDFGYGVGETDFEYSRLNFENTVWVLAVGNHLDSNIRTTLLSTVKNLEPFVGATTIKETYSFFPTVTQPSGYKNELPTRYYESDSAAAQFSAAVKELYKGKIPAYTLGYPNIYMMKNTASSIASGLQSELGALINIKEYENASYLNQAAMNREVDLLLIPIKADTTDAVAYLDSFTTISSFAGIDNTTLNKCAKLVSDSKFSDAEAALYRLNTLLPLAVCSDSVYYSERILNAEFSYNNGYIDLASIKKLLD